MKLLKETIKPIYYRLPPSLRQPYGYAKMYRFYRDAQFWSKERIRIWQLEKFKEIVNYAYENVPGYQQLYKEANICPNDINNLNDVKNLPFTSKTLIRDNLSDFTSRSIKKSQIRKCTTGGSTGIPFGFYYDKMSSVVEYAFMHNAWATIGWHINDKGVILRGGFVGTSDRFFKKTENSRYNLSSYFLTEANYPSYKSIIKKTKPTFLHAYPSSASDLARMVIRFEDISNVEFKSIFLGSENLYKWQNDVIRKAFPSAKIMCWYGHTERAIWAPYCENIDKYHCCPFYGFTELLGENNNEIDKGETGELVGTSFWMKATPFIRYRTMDYATKGENGCKKCGRNFQLLDSIEGRLQEIILSKTGRRISMTAINMHDDTFGEVSQFRFFQDRVGELVILVVPKDSFTIDSEKKIQNNIGSKLGADFTLTVKRVEHLAKSVSGKYSFLEQKLNIEHSDRVVL
jgi:phenylacetate-CoA ligase